MDHGDGKSKRVRICTLGSPLGQVPSSHSSSPVLQEYNELRLVALARNMGKYE